jgi:CRISPR-associated endonuclease Cas1/CRISPR-associated protein Cas4
MNQQELDLPFPELSADQPLLPARMVNEYVYCPRLAYLEWVQGEWAESADTVEGAHAHRRVNRSGGRLPAAAELGAEDRIHARSITLSSNRLGLIAKLDLIESEEGRVVPVDYKRGKRPHVEKGAYAPERVQLCAQGMLLEEQGYECTEGVLYFVAGRERVRVIFDEELRHETRQAIQGLRLAAAAGRIPPPLVDSPKCPRCSLVGICLPDEVNFLRDAEKGELRPLGVTRDEALPMHVQARGAKVSKKGDNLIVSIDDEEVTSARLIDVSQLALYGNIYVTTPALSELMWRGVPVTWHSFGGWFLGHTVGNGHKNVELRTAQYQASFDEQVCLHFARGLVEAKIQNARTLLRRNWKGAGDPKPVLSDLMSDVRHARRAKSLPELLGVEGTAASRYFGQFRNLLKQAEGDEAMTFDFRTRNRRPPTDPVNALLSFAYTLLVRSWSVALTAVGFDAFRGLYHQPRYGRPALALDMMEPFRPLLADSSVIQAINNGEVRPTDFIEAAGAVNLQADGRKRFIATFERRLDQEVTHPLFGYRVSYRRLLEIQARLLGRFLLGELREYPNFTTR